MIVYTNTAVPAAAAECRDDVEDECCSFRSQRALPPPRHTHKYMPNIYINCLTRYKMYFHKVSVKVRHPHVQSQPRLVAQAAMFRNNPLFYSEGGLGKMMDFLTDQSTVVYSQGMDGRTISRSMETEPFQSLKG